MRKVLLEPFTGVEYEEGSDGLMQPRCNIDAMKIVRPRGELLFRQMRRHGEPPYVLVFGWRVRDEILSNGMVRIHVDTLSEIGKDMFRAEIEAQTEGSLAIW